MVLQGWKTHAHNGAASLPKRLVRLVNGALQPFLAQLGIAIEQACRGFQLVHHPGEALQQGVVQLAGHARAFLGHQLETGNEPSHAEPVESPDQESQCSRARRREPGGLVKVRGQAKREASPRRVPDPVIIAGNHMESIPARRQVDVHDIAPCARIRPSPIKTIQFVPEADPFRSHQAQTGICDLQLTAAKSNLRGRIDVCRPPIHQDLFDDYGGRQRIAADAGRINHRNAVLRANPEAPILGSGQPGPHHADGICQAQPVASAVLCEGETLWGTIRCLVQFRHAQPQQAIARGQP